jgi:hypothetical protein
MSILGKLKDKISQASQRALGIDAVRFQLQTNSEKLDRLNHIEHKLASVEAQLQNLKSFLTWYTNRVEPWFWTGNFSQADPEEELAGLLFNFLPGRVLVEIGPPGAFAKAATEIGYQVHSFEPPKRPELLAELSGQIDFLNVGPAQFNFETTQLITSIHPSVVQAGFMDQDSLPTSPGAKATRVLPLSGMITELRQQEYYWNIIVFRNRPDDFIRMGTNLASVPSGAWGSILFFKDYQLFLKAFHWCRTTLPRFRVAPLAK